MPESTTGSKPTGTTGSNEKSYERVLEHASALGPSVRELTGSGAYSGLGGVVTFGRGLRSLRRGETGRGLWRLAAGGLFVAIAVAQWRSSRSASRDDTRSTDDDTDTDDTDLVTTGFDGASNDDREPDTGESTDDGETNTGSESDETASSDRLD